VALDAQAANSRVHICQNPSDSGQSDKFLRNIGGTSDAIVTSLAGLLSQGV
jgi:hypothetical protein